MAWLMSEWARDLRHSSRSLMRTPAFTAVAVGTLGLAIGANAGMFSVVNTVLLNPLPFENAERPVYIAGTAPGSDLPPEFGLSSEFYVQYAEQSKLLEDVSTVNSFTSTLRTSDRVERVRMSSPTTSLFSTLGAQPILGRLPVADDADRVAVISSELWRTWFGGDTAIIGRSIQMAGSMRTVIGIMGPEFRFPDDGTLLWLSTTITAADVELGQFGVGMVGRMAPGATPATVAAELNQLASRLPERFGGSTTYADIMTKHRAVVRPLDEQMLGPVARPLWVLLSAVSIVLLIACANVANLFLVRAEGRQRDLAIRRAIGAARRQLIRLQLAEALIVALLAGILALVLATVTLPILLRAAPEGIPRMYAVTLGAPSIIFTLAAALLAALICSAVPVWRAMTPDMQRLREGGRGSTRRHHHGRDALVVGQTALALVLLIASGLLVRSFDRLRNVDPGYETQNIFTFQFAPEQEILNDGPSFARFHLAMLERLAAMPGVESVGIVENIPLNEGSGPGRVRTQEMSGPGDGSLVHFTFSAGDYFGTMGIAALHGRVFQQTDHSSAPGNVVISRSAAELLWPGQDAIGRRVQLVDMPEWHTVVGVVEDVLQEDFRGTANPLFYLPLIGPTPESWRVSTPAYVVKTARAETIAPEIRRLIDEIAPEAPMYRTFTMAGLAKDSMVQLSFMMLILGITSVLALILGGVGLYGVLSYVVAQRTREIGVRMALGARAAQVRSMVVAQGARVVTLGVVIGIAVALATTRALGSLLYGVEPVDVTTFLAMSATMILIGLLASYLPARRASSVDPMESMRTD